IRAKIIRRGYIRHSLYSFDIDGCQFFITRRRNPVANAMYKMLRLETYTNINHSCPYNHDIIIDHLVIDDTFDFYLPIPSGDYIIKSFWLAQSVLSATISYFIFIFP
ncbi:hypothetical protein KR222_008633, partial [Zaprionus bogoriensis]